MSTPATKIIGSYLSPYVRKVLVCLELKGVAYQIDPIIPFFGDDEFSRLSPLRRVPVLVDKRVTLADSTVICEYLDEQYGVPALLPAGPVDRARARWLEEFADTRMGEVFIWRLFNQVVINRFVWGKATDDAVVRRAVAIEIPAILGFLEREVPPEGYFFDHISIADIAIASFFRNAAFAKLSVDSQRWPRTAAYVARVLGQPAFVRLGAFEDLLLKTPIPRYRDALLAAGAPISADTVGTPVPRPGVLTTSI